MAPLGSAQALEKIVLTIDEAGGRFSLVVNKDADPPYMAAMEWGEEAPDSPMYAAAAYGGGDNASEAISSMLMDAGK